MRKVFLLLTVFAFIAVGNVRADEYIEKKSSAYTYKSIYDTIYLTLDQSTPQTITASPIWTTLTSTYLPYSNASKQLVNSNMTTDGTNFSTTGTITDLTHYFGSSTGVSATATDGVLQLTGLKSEHTEALSIDFAHYGIDITNTGSAHPNNAQLNFRDFPFVYFINTGIDHGNAIGKGCEIGYDATDRASNTYLITHAGFTAPTTWDSVWIISTGGENSTDYFYEPKEWYLYDYKNDWGYIMLTPSDKTIYFDGLRVGFLEGRGLSSILHTFIQGGAQLDDITYTLPTGYPTANSQTLLCSTAGVWSWGTNFGANNLTTTGTLNAGAITGTSFNIGGVTLPTISSTNTLTNKRHTPRIYSTASIAGAPGVLTPEIDTYDYFELTAQAAPLNIANHSSSTMTGGEKIIIAITSDATPRALTYGTDYVAKGGVALPTTTVASKTTTLGFIFSAGLGKWNLVAVAQEA